MLNYSSIQWHTNMSIRGIGKFWDKWESGWKVITAGITAMTIMLASIGWALDIKSKADRVPGLEHDIDTMRQDVAEIKNDVKWIMRSMGGK